MNFYMYKYERRFHDSEKWEEVSEPDLLVDLIELQGRVTPFLQQIIEGKHILTHKAVYRLKLGN